MKIITITIIMKMIIILAMITGTTMKRTEMILMILTKTF